MYKGIEPNLVANLHPISLCYSKNQEDLRTFQHECSSCFYWRGIGSVVEVGTGKHPSFQSATSVDQHPSFECYCCHVVRLLLPVVDE